MVKAENRKTIREQMFVRQIAQKCIIYIFSQIIQK